MKTVKIFLASSEELGEERKEIADLVDNLNFKLRNQDLNIQLIKWEYLDSSMGALHKQEEYNNELKDCELCLVMYWKRFGKYTKTELDTAYGELCAGHNPQKLYVYFKDDDEIAPELAEFRDSFPDKYGHFYCHFLNIDTLKADFLLQFMEYLNAVLKDRSVIEIRNSQITIDGKVYVNLQNVPFAGNNEEYNLLLKSIKKTRKILSITETDDPDYAEYAAELRELEKKQEQMEASLWDTALMVTRLSTTHCSERLQRAMEFFSQGDNKGAKAILNEEEISKDVQHNLHLMELGDEGRRGLKTNIEEYRLKIKTLRNEMSEGWLDQIISLNQTILNLSIRVYGKNSGEAAQANDDLGQSYHVSGRYQEALEYRLKAMSIREAIFGEMHTDTATSYNNVGGEYGALGDHQKALEYKMKALSIREEVYGEKHPDTAASYNNVGYEYGYLGLNQKALEYIFKALSIVDTYGDRDHIATSYNNIAHLYRDLGDYQKALEFNLKAMSIREEIFGERHPDTAIVYDNIGGVYSNLGDNNKALEYKLKALSIFKYVFGEKHPDTATTYNNVGHIYENLGDLQKAIEYKLKALEIAEAINHKALIAALHNRVARSYKAAGDMKNAKAHYLQAAELSKELGNLNDYNNNMAEMSEIKE